MLRIGKSQGTLSRDAGLKAVLMIGKSQGTLSRGAGLKAVLRIGKSQGTLSRGAGLKAVLRIGKSQGTLSRVAGLKAVPSAFVAPYTSVKTFILHTKKQFLYARLKNGRIMLWQCPSVCLSVRPSVRPSEFSGLFFNML